VGASDDWAKTMETAPPAITATATAPIGILSRFITCPFLDLKGVVPNNKASKKKADPGNGR
jgi:hypothetical protein